MIVKINCFQLEIRHFISKSVHVVSIIFKAAIQPFINLLNWRSQYDYHISPGGIENAGNSCVLSVMLQDLASEEFFYDEMFDKKLTQKKDESSRQFQKRLDLQKHLKKCVSNLRQQKTVLKQEIITLRELLFQAGWDDYVQPLWHRFLNKILPDLFPLSKINPFGLFYTIRTLFEVKDYHVDRQDDFYHRWSSSCEKANPVLILEYRKESGSIEEFLKKIPLPYDSGQRLLCRVRILNPKDCLAVPKQVNELGQQFFLKQAHVINSSGRNQHVFMYKKVNENWFCHDDHQIFQSDLPKAPFFNLIYELHN